VEPEVEPEVESEVESEVEPEVEPEVESDVAEDGEGVGMGAAGRQACCTNANGGTARIKANTIKEFGQPCRSPNRLLKYSRPKQHASCLCG